MIPKELHGTLGCGTYKVSNEPVKTDHFVIDGKTYRRLGLDELVVDGSDYYAAGEVPVMMTNVIRGHTGKPASFIKSFAADWNVYRLV